MAKTCYVALVVFMVCCAAYVYGSSDDVEAAWESFQVKQLMTERRDCNTSLRNLDLKAHHPINTKSNTEAAKRKVNFVKVHAMIQEHNKNKNATFQMEHNKFSVLVGITIFLF